MAANCCIEYLYHENRRIEGVEVIYAMLCGKKFETLDNWMVGQGVSETTEVHHRLQPKMWWPPTDFTSLHQSRLLTALFNFIVINSIQL